MRFPFTFMGLVSLAFGVWVIIFFALHRAGFPELGVAILMLVFGSYLLYRRVTRGREA